MHQNFAFQIVAVFTTFLFIIYIISDFTDYTDYSEEPEVYKRYHTSSYSRSQREKSQKIKWSDNKFIAQSYKRVGFGENGIPGILKDPEEIKENEELFKTFGMSVVVSDKISVNRSVPDFRVRG